MGVNIFFLPWLKCSGVKNRDMIWISFVYLTKKCARLSVQSSELGPPTPHPQASVTIPFPLLGPIGKRTRLRGGPNSDEGSRRTVFRVFSNVIEQSGKKSRKKRIQLHAYRYCFLTIQLLGSTIPRKKVCTVHIYNSNDSTIYCTLIQDIYLSLWHFIVSSTWD